VFFPPGDVPDAGTVVYTPGVRVQLPVANGLPGTDRPTVAVTIAKGGQLYFQNQVIEAKELRGRLAAAAKTTAEPLTLIVLMDAEVTGQMLMNLSLLARDAGDYRTVMGCGAGHAPGPGRTLDQMTAAPVEREAWPRRRWWLTLLLVFTGQLAFISV